MKVKAKELYGERACFPAEGWPIRQYSVRLTRMGLQNTGVAIIHLTEEVQHGPSRVWERVRDERKIIDLYAEPAGDSDLIRLAIVAFDDFRLNTTTGAGDQDEAPETAID